MAHPWQLLDRPVEFDAIRSSLTGEGGGVVLVGPAGVGKTTLARSVTASLTSNVHWVAATQSARTIPLGAFANQVGQSGSRDPLALLAAARQSLLTQRNPVVGVDDAYLLDQLSATLVHQIATDRAARVIATVRSGERVPDAVTSLWKDGYLKRFELAPFSKAESIKLVESVLGGTLEGLSADVMWKSSGGNPLFLRHLVEGALEGNSLTEVDGVWQLRGSLGVSTGLASLLEDRLERASEEVMHALKLLALCEPLAVDALCSLAGDEAVDAAEVQGLIRLSDDGGRLDARFSHPLYAEVVRRRIGTVMARRLRGRIVAALGREPTPTPASRIRLAQLYVGSDQVPDAELLFSAAKDAISLSDVALGEQLAHAAYEQTKDLRIAELLARALLWQGRPTQADAVLTEFQPDTLDEMQILLWGLPRMSILFWSMGEVAQAHEVLDIMTTRIQHPTLELVVAAVNSAVQVHENKIAEGIATAESVLSDPESPKQAREFAAFSLGLAMPAAGRGSAYRPIADWCRAEQKGTDGMIKVMARYGDVLALTTIGELDLADERVTEYTNFSSAGQRLGWAIARIMAGLVMTYRGRFPDAVSSIEQALAAMAAQVPLPWRLPARILLAKAYAALGDTAQAERVLADAEEHSGTSVALHEPQRLIARSWLAAAQSGQRTAVDLAHVAADLAQRTGQLAVEAEALHAAARFGDRSVAGRLAALVDRVDGSVVAMQARHADAVATSDGHALAALSADFETSGFLLYAAEAAAQAASLHERAGARGLSAESAARALRLATQCGGAKMPAIRQAAAPLPLTSREREIAGLAAAGLTNREIADRLTVSVRTIEGHIYRACIKLDVTDRDALAEIVGRDS